MFGFDDAKHNQLKRNATFTKTSAAKREISGKVRYNTMATVLWGVLYNCHPAILDPVLEKLPSLSWGRWKRDIELSAAPMPSQCSAAFMDRIEAEWSVKFLTHLIPPAQFKGKKGVLKRKVLWVNEGFA